MTTTTQLERAALLTSTVIAKILEARHDILALSAVCDEAQNSPPDGAADGSIDEATWYELRRLADALENALFEVALRG